MPPARTLRQRAVTNENDENAAPAHRTRAKAASNGGQDELSEGLVKKALQSKKSGGNTLNGAAAQRKRPALGDVSNVSKNNGLGGEVKESKKKASTSVSKASQSAGVQKSSKQTGSRGVLAAKDNNKKTSSSELKRTASGSGVMGGAHKKRSTSSGTQSIKQETPVSTENEEPSFKVESEAKVEIAETINVDEKSASVKRELPPGVPDLDEEDFEDPLMVAEYAAEIFEYLRELEQTTMPNPDYMDHQDHIDWNDRDVLNDWLVQVHQRFQLLPETFYLAINIIDRFLSTKIVQLDKLQLVGITALFIASKYEEVISPHVSNFTYMAKDYTDSEILSAERFILAALNYELSYPNPMNFLRRISKADNYDIQSRTLGKYLLEISVLDNRFMEFCPSHVSAAAMYMARMILNRGDWDETIAHYSGYTEQEILPLFELLLDYCTGDVKHDAFHAKYASKRYLKASLLVRQWAENYLEKQRRNLFAKDVKSR